MYLPIDAWNNLIVIDIDSRMSSKGTFVASCRSKWPLTLICILSFISLSLLVASPTSPAPPASSASASSRSLPLVTSQLCLAPISRAAPQYSQTVQPGTHLHAGKPPGARTLPKKRPACERASPMRHKTRSLLFPLSSNHQPSPSSLSSAVYG